MKTNCWWIVLAASVAALNSHAFAQVDTTIDQSALHESIEQALREESLVGAVWFLLTPDETVTGAAGLRDARYNEPLSATNKVQVGSVVKTLIATAVLKFVSEGSLALDTPVAALLPDVAFQNPWLESHPLLLRHLLDHTSGLDDARFWQVFSLEAQPDAPLRASLGSDPSLLRLRSRPGTRLSYSNLGYTILGMVIEAVAESAREFRVS